MRQRHLKSVFDLSKDLGFADHHRVEAARHAKQVGDGAVTGLPIQMRGQLLRRHGQVGVSKKFLNATIPGLEFLHDRIDFDPVAGRQQHAFFNP